MKTGRLFHIIHRLLQGGRTTAPALAQELEVSVRTLYRDIEALCQAGVPVVTEPGKTREEARAELQQFFPRLKRWAGSPIAP